MGKSVFNASAKVVQFFSSTSLPSFPSWSIETSACIPTAAKSSLLLLKLDAGEIRVVRAKAENNSRIDRNASTTLICPLLSSIVVWHTPASYNTFIEHRVYTYNVS